MRIFMKAALITALGASFLIRALHAEETLKYRFDGAEALFSRIEKEDLLINQSCAKADCEARKALKKASTIGLQIQGGANPGSKICIKIGGTVALALDSDNNQLTFCRFPDGSAVSSGSVYSRALRNDLQRE